MNILKQNSKGDEVRAIQTFLHGRGLYNGSIDARFGPNTKAAVSAYQKSKFLAADGIVGNLTLAAMLTDGLTLMPSPDTAPVGTYPTSFPPRPSFGPLSSNAERAAVFGKFAYVSAPVSGNPEAIRITDGWADRNISTVIIPQLVTAGVHATGRATMHRLVIAQTLALWDAWEKAGLLKHVKSWEGMYVPRFVRGSRSTLSNHAFGSAFDINYTGNELGATPAAVGTKNSVRELVPLAHQHGFYWGGHFSRGDGMHFEVAKLIP